MASSHDLTQYTETPAVKTLDLSAAGTENLIAFGADQRQRYLNNAPFPHLVIDNLFPTALLEDVLQDTLQKVQQGIQTDACDPQTMGPTVQRFLLDLCSAKFCLFLEALTGIEGIIPDPHFEGGGVHEMAQGDFLKVRPGSNWNNKLKLDRRLNLMIYLNHDWENSWGGHLELWGEEMKNQFVEVPPLFNKTVIFSTTDDSYYGLPNPLACPEDRRSRSLALRYYSNGRPAREVALPQSTGTYYTDTYHLERPDEMFAPPQPPHQPGYAPSYATGRTKSSPKMNVPASARVVTAQVKKSIKKSLPKPLMALYRAGKRSLRG
jgi:Rps23 Pro-64 3,4-dihydroxylase Tpa1-like proline 4-hydroxylase